MKEYRDTQLGELLRSADEAPPLAPDFDARLWARIELESVAGSRVARPGVSVPTLLRRLGRRRVVAVVIAVAACAAAAVSLFGLPGVSRVTGPQPVSAAQVIERALHALSTGKTVQAFSTDREALDFLPGGGVVYKVAHFRVFARADGSFRQRQIGEAQIRPRVRLGERPDKLDASDWAYDAAAGVLREYWRGWVNYEFGGRYEHVMSVTTGYPLGPPDCWANFQSNLTATALALRGAGAGGGTTLTKTSLGGRPVWVISGFELALSPWEQTYSVTIDQETCLPIRLRAQREDLLLAGFTMDWSWSHVRIDEPLPDSAFTFTFAPPKGAKVVRSDAGFRRVSPHEIGSKAGYAPLLPSWLPTGYVQQAVAAAARSTTANGATKGRHVVAVQYVRGFDALTITTRTVTDPQGAAMVDPFEPDVSWAEVVQKDVRLEAGAFTGVTARVVVGPRVTIPHLYAVKDGVLLTLAGSASAEELISVAESLQPYVAD